MTGLVTNILLALAWALISQDFSTTSVMFGLVLGYVILRLLKPALPATQRYVDKTGLVVRFFGYFLWELMRANMRMVYHVLTPHGSMSPGVVGVPLESMTDTEATFLANVITLTPGTLSVDVQMTGERDEHQRAPRILYVHVVDCEDPDAVRAELKGGFERRMLEVTR